MNASPISKRRSVFADRLLDFPDLVFSDGAEFRHRGEWHAFFRDRIGPSFDGRIIFEIGCFDASLLVKVAPKFPTTAFIGIDWKCRALHTGATQLAAAGLQNAALLHGRAQDLRRFFTDGELHEVLLFHPDPCDKAKELPNRLISEPFLLDVHCVLNDGGRFILKTDHRGYYQSVIELQGHQAIADRFEILVNATDFWNDNAARTRAVDRVFAGEVTTFERRFMKRRRPIYYVDLKMRGKTSPRT